MDNIRRLSWVAREVTFTRLACLAAQYSVLSTQYLLEAS